MKGSTMPVKAKNLVRVRLLCGRVGQVVRTDPQTKRPVIVSEFAQSFGDEIDVSAETAERMCLDHSAELITV
jgi:hypothetical protein